MDIYFYCDAHILQITLSREINRYDLFRLQAAIKKHHCFNLEIRIFLNDPQNNSWVNAASMQVLNMLKQSVDAVILDLKVRAYTPGKVCCVLGYREKNFNWSRSVSPQQRRASEEWMRAYYSQLLSAIPLARGESPRSLFYGSVSCGQKPPALQLPAPAHTQDGQRSPKKRGAVDRSIFRRGHLDAKSATPRSRSRSILGQIARMNDDATNTSSCLLL